MKKIIASLLPRRSRSVWSGTFKRSHPSNVTDPLISAECFGKSPMMASERRSVPVVRSPSEVQLCPLSVLR